MYTQILDIITNTASIRSIKRDTDGACIPFDPDNTDYQRFKNDLANGAQLNDANNNPMTAEQITEFLGTLP
jgi:hypothetical protein